MSIIGLGILTFNRHIRIVYCVVLSFVRVTFIVDNQIIEWFSIIPGSWIIVFLTCLLVYPCLVITNQSFYNFLIWQRLALLCVFFSTRNFLVLFSSFEFILAPIFLIILVYGYQPERVQALLWITLYTLVGSIPFLVFIINIRSSSSGFDISTIPSVEFILFWIAIFTIRVKLPVFGVHSWLPKAHVQAPVVGSILLAGLLLKIGGWGIYLLGRVCNPDALSKQIVLYIALLGSCIAFIYCFVLDDLKQIVAYSSVGHIGLVLRSSLINNSLSFRSIILIITGHGLVRSLIFYLVNEGYKELGSRSTSLFRGITNVIPTFGLVWAFSLILNSSLPPSINLWGELLGFIGIAQLWPIIFPWGVVFVTMGGTFNIYILVITLHGSQIKYPLATKKDRTYIVSIIHLVPILLVASILVNL